MFIRNPTRFLALTALISVLLFGGIETATSGNIKVSFKLDPSLTRGMYMGDRWVSPPTFVASQQGKTCIIEARVEGLDKGVTPTWTPSVPNMVRVVPVQGQQVTITVLRAGQSSLNMTSQGVSKTLSIKAVYEGEEIEVEISQ